MKANIFLVLVFLTSILSAQQRYFSATKTKNNKILTVKEGKRVKVKTKKGEKLIGRLLLLDEETIAIKGTIIPLSEIAQFKRKTVAGAVGGVFVIVYSGLIGSLGTAFAITEIDTEILIPTLGFTLIGVAGGILINDSPPNHDHNNWTYKINIHE